MNDWTALISQLSHKSLLVLTFIYKKSMKMVQVTLKIPLTNKQKDSQPLVKCLVICYLQWYNGLQLLIVDNIFDKPELLKQLATVCRKYQTVCRKYQIVSRKYQTVYRKYQTVCHKYQTVCHKYQTVCCKYKTVCCKYKKNMRFKPILLHCGFYKLWVSQLFMHSMMSFKFVIVYFLY